MHEVKLSRTAKGYSVESTLEISEADVMIGAPGTTEDSQTLLAEVKRLQIVASTLAVERNLARDAIKGLEALAKQLAEALPDSQKLRMLAEHFDIKYAANPQDDEVQRDLRLWAQTSETALATYETAMGEKA